MPAKPPSPPAQSAPRVTLRILETTDLHVHILPYDYFADRPAPATGLARTAELIRQARAGADNCLLFDNGDFLQGTPMSDWAAEQDGPHPMITAMNLLGYDGATLGNHEFNYGLPKLRQIMDQANFPFVSANLTAPSGPPLAPPWRILRRDVTAGDGTIHSLNIGIIGFAPPQISAWDRYTPGEHVQTQDIVTSARTIVPELRVAGADVVIALAHTGIGEEVHTPGMENAAVPLAEVPGIDVLLTGHIHGVFPGSGFASSGVINAARGTLHGKPTVMAGYHGGHLGQIDLTLQPGPDGWQTIDHTSLCIPTTPGPADPAMAAATQSAHDRVLTIIRAPLTETAAPLYSHFAMVAPNAALTLVSDAMAQAAATALKGTDHAALPLLTATAPVKAGGWGRPDNVTDIPAGPLVFRHAAELYPFPNDLCLLHLTGRDICAWLEHAATAFHQITPGKREQPLINTQMPSYNFDVLHGLTYVLDPSQPVGNRLLSVQLNDGSPLQDDTQVILATNGYRAAGGGGYDMARMARILPQGRRPLRDIITDYLSGQPRVTPQSRPVWSFAPLPDTTAWFETAASGIAHLTDPANAHITGDRQGRGGLHRYLCHFTPAPS